MPGLQPVIWAALGLIAVLKFSFGENSHLS